VQYLVADCICTGARTMVNQLRRHSLHISKLRLGQRGSSLLNDFEVPHAEMGIEIRAELGIEIRVELGIGSGLS